MNRAIVVIIAVVAVAIGAYLFLAGPGADPAAPTDAATDAPADPVIEAPATDGITPPETAPESGTGN